MADLTIQLRHLNSNEILKETYGDYYPFRVQYANIPADFTGILHQPYPSDGCGYIERLSDQALEGDYPWVAVVGNYTLCTKEMITNVRNAGYGLLLAYSSDDISLSVDNFILNSGFGVAVFSYDFYETLQGYLVPDVNVTSHKVVVIVQGSALLTPALSTFIFMMVLGLCGCTLCCCCYVYCRRQHNQGLAEQMADIDARRRNFERVQRQERIARQQLIESILRQLQELQIDMRSQEPLGRDTTTNLPTRKYCEGEEKIERCAICVEDFKDGDSLRVLPCEHVFHKECIDEWLINHSSLCPLCKFEVPRGNANQPPPRPERGSYSTEDGLSLSSADLSYSSLEEDVPMILVSHTAQQNSNHGVIGQYGSV